MSSGNKNLNKSSSFGMQSSLSMRMRSESTRFPNTSVSSFHTKGDNVSEDIILLNTSFPDINERPRSTSPPLSKSYIDRTFKDKIPPKHLRTKNQFERLSGGYDFMASSGVFPDRGVVSHPSSSCVRCSSHASVCMSCVEAIGEESLLFYRTTRAQGAASLINKTLKTVGMMTLFKWVLFKTWYNGFKLRRKIEGKMRFVVLKSFNRSFCKKPFEALKKFAKENIIERMTKEAEIQQFQIDKLNVQVDKCAIEKENFDRQLGDILEKLNTKDKLINSQKKEIDALDKELHKERNRVIGLSSLTESVSLLTNIVNNLANNASVEIKGNISKMKSRPSNFNYSRIYRDEEKLNVILAKNLENVKNNTSKNVEYDKIVMDWINELSDEASFLIDPVSKIPVEPSLPGFDKIKKIESLANGEQFCRVIIVLMYHLFKAPPSHLKENPPKFLSSKDLKDIGLYLTKSTEEFIRFLFFLLDHYLNVSDSMLKAQEISFSKIAVGDLNSIHSFISILMMIDTPCGHSEDANQVAGQQSNFDLANNALGNSLNERKNMQYITELQKVWSQMKDKEMISEIPELAPEEIIIEKEDEDDNPIPKEVVNEENKEDDDESKEEEKKDEKKDGEFDLGIYSELSSAVDIFLRTDGVKLSKVVLNMGTSILQLSKLKEEFEIIDIDAQRGSRIATDVRNHVLRKQLVKM
jgi:hypothetical protein